MDLSVKSFISYVFHNRGDIENEDQINRSIFYDLLHEMRIIVIAGAATQIVLALATYSFPEYYGDYINYFYYLYAGLFFLMIVSLCIIRYVRNDYENRLVKLLWISPLMTLIIISGAVGYSVLESYAKGFLTPCVFMIVYLGVPLFNYMRPRAFIGISLIVDALMLYFYIDKGDRFDNPGVSIFTLMIFMFVALIAGLVKMFLQFSYRSNFISNEIQKKEIRDLNTAQNHFFSSMSHEIRTPINTIIGLNEMTLREKVSDEVAENSVNIRAAGNILLHLINDILDMSKISSGQMTLTMSTYHPGDMLSDIVGMMWIRCKEKGLDFHVEVSPDIPAELYGDEVRIKQILINLLNNAIKYTQKGSVTLSIQCREIKDGNALIEYYVTDTGMGIKKENIPYLFDSFRRVDEDKNKYIEGTGLGLSIVKQLTELMEGSVSVNSVYTSGSTFVVSIPQKVTDTKTIGKVNFEEKRKSNQSGSYKCSFEAPEAKILAVDDNASNLLVITKLLRDTKVLIDTADSGRRALDMTLLKNYDLILMDHMMPEMDGIECMHKIREQVGGLSRDAKVIALTANAGSEDRKLYAKEGFDGYIVKPINSSELENELIRLLPQNLVTILGTEDDIVEQSIQWMEGNTRKKSIIITTESCADIPTVLKERYNILTIPHKVETENGIFADSEEVDSDGLLEYINSDGKVITHEPTVEEHEEFFAKALLSASNVIHISISSKIAHSGYENAITAARSFDNVTVFDTSHLSSGQGIVAIEASILASEGLSVGEIIKRLSSFRSNVRTSFIVDSLDFLAKSGQISKKVAAVGDALMFHPVIDMIGGKMITNRFYFGTRHHAWGRYISSTLSNVSDIDKKNVFITYVGLTRKELDYIAEIVEKRVHFENIYFTKAAPSISVNCGPGTFGVLFSVKN